MKIRGDGHGGRGGVRAERGRKGRGSPGEHGEMAGQAVALAPETGFSPDLEAGFGQPAPDMAGRAEGCQRRAGPRSAREQREQSGVPHRGIAGRGEAVEKPGIHARGLIAPHLLGIAEHHGQVDVVGQPQAMKAGRQRRILLAQRGGRTGQRGPCIQRPCEVAERQRVALGGQQRQACPARCGPGEQVGGKQHVQAGPEPRLADHEQLAGSQSGEAVRQVIALDEYGLRFGRPVFAGEVAVAVIAGDRRGPLPVDAGRLDGVEIRLHAPIVAGLAGVRWRRPGANAACRGMAGRRSGW